MSCSIDAGSVDARIVAVVVAYAPEAEGFRLVLKRAAEQVHAIVVVDNGQGIGLEAVAWGERLEHLDMHGNAGIAAAQNAGLRHAFGGGASHVLLLDDDSVLDPSTTKLLMAAWCAKVQIGRRVAAVGANFRDPRGRNVSPFIRIVGWRRYRMDTESAAVVDASYVISSGSLISREAFETVGPMNDELFIDYVDIEWGLRAGLKGWECFGASEARLLHSLGDGPLRIFGTNHSFHSPLRHYYMIRNGVWMLLRTSLPASWKVVEAWHLLRRAVAYSVFAPKAHLHIAAMLHGLLDGLRGRMGARGARHHSYQ